MEGLVSEQIGEQTNKNNVLKDVNTVLRRESSVCSIFSQYGTSGGPEGNKRWQSTQYYLTSLEHYILPHIFFIDRLQKLGLTDPPLSWLQNYLQNRIFRTKINRVHVSWGYSAQRVPQGTVLSPFPFLIFIITC